MPRQLCAAMLYILCIVAVSPACLLPNAFGLAGSTAKNGSNAAAIHDLGITGKGINIGLISAANTLTTHQAFKDANDLSHAFSYDFTGDGVLPNHHDTNTAGIVISRGDPNHPDDLGVAPGADIHSARVIKGVYPNQSIDTQYFIDALEELVVNQNCRVIVTVIQLTANPDGKSTWSKIYDYYAYEYDVIFANAAGNFIYDENNVLINDDITVFGDAYNGITTGGLITTESNVYDRVGSRSNTGPTQDERNKPDITAPSQYQTTPGANNNYHWMTIGSSWGETSYSTPHTAGAAALLLEFADQTPQTDDDQNEVIRAVIVNSTFPNINDRDNNPTTGQTYHLQRGHGRIDALRAYQTLAGEKITTSTTSTAMQGWAFENIAKKASHTYTIYVEKNQRLITTLTWDRLVSSSYSAENPIVNLNLKITDPDDAPVISLEDTDNNLKKIDTLAQITGNYRVTIENKNRFKGRDYAFAFEIIPPLTGDFDLNYIVGINDLLIFANQWLQTGTSLSADLIEDNTVNLLDFAVIADNWLNINPAYYP